MKKFGLTLLVAVVAVNLSDPFSISMNWASPVDRKHIGKKI